MSYQQIDGKQLKVISKLLKEAQCLDDEIKASHGLDRVSVGKVQFYSIDGDVVATVVQESGEWSINFDEERL